MLDYQVGPPGLEPGTTWLWVRCSNQLSYGPALPWAANLGMQNKKIRHENTNNLYFPSIKKNTTKLLALDEE